MRCRWELKLNAYWDGELPTKEQEQVAEHLMACLHCQATIAEWQKLRQWFQQDSVPTSRIAVVETLRRLAKEGAVKKPLLLLWLERLDALFVRPKFSFGAAMTVALILALLFANVPQLPTTFAEQLKFHIGRTLQEFTVLSPFR